MTRPARRGLYWIKGRIGLMQTELRLDQAVPVGLFGLVIGWLLAIVDRSRRWGRSPTRRR